MATRCSTLLKQQPFRDGGTKALRDFSPDFIPSSRHYSMEIDKGALSFVNWSTSCLYGTNPTGRSSAMSSMAMNKGVIQRRIVQVLKARVSSTPVLTDFTMICNDVATAWQGAHVSHHHCSLQERPEQESHVAFEVASMDGSFIMQCVDVEYHRY